MMMYRTNDILKRTLVNNSNSLTRMLSTVEMRRTTTTTIVGCSKYIRWRSISGITHKNCYQFDVGHHSQLSSTTPTTPHKSNLMGIQQQQRGCQELIVSSRPFSTLSLDDDYTCPIDENGPFGELFQSTKKTGRGQSLIGQKGCIHRTFGPRDNVEAILATGGEALAAHASFDPNYRRAQGWIRKHAVGPAVLSPVLLQGLTGALSEAAFPEAVLVSQSMSQINPLIVGVAVKATILVQSVEPSTKVMNEEAGEKNGFIIVLKTDVSRLRDNELIVQGMQTIWIPDYSNM